PAALPLPSIHHFAPHRVGSPVAAAPSDATPSPPSPAPPADAPPARPEPPPGPPAPLPPGRSDPPGPDEPAPPDPDDPAPPGPFALATRSERSTPVVPRTTSRTCARLFDTEFASFDSPSVDTIDRSLMFA